MEPRGTWQGEGAVGGHSADVLGVGPAGGGPAAAGGNGAGLGCEEPSAPRWRSGEAVKCGRGDGSGYYSSLHQSLLGRRGGLERTGGGRGGRIKGGGVLVVAALRGGDGEAAKLCRGRVPRRQGRRGCADRCTSRPGPGAHQGSKVLADAVDGREPRQRRGGCCPGRGDVDPRRGGVARDRGHAQGRCKHGRR